MSDQDRKRAEHLRRMAIHLEAQRVAALDDAGKRDLSRAQTKAAQEAARVSGVQGLRAKGIKA